MLVPKKSLGQNFLIDHNICNKITKLINIKNQNIIEIGPGRGMLTDKIYNQKPKKLILIEKDYNLYKILKKKYKNINNILIYNCDALNFNFEKIKDLKIISNLPYNIATKVILKLIINYKNINKMVFMIQKETSEKFKYKRKKK